MSVLKDQGLPQLCFCHLTVSLSRTRGASFRTERQPSREMCEGIILFCCASKGVISMRVGRANGFFIGEEIRFDTTGPRRSVFSSILL